MAAVVLMILGLAPNAAAKAPKAEHRAKPQHFHRAPEAKPGLPSRRVKDRKLDEQLEKVVARQNNRETTDTIVVLQQGESLPPGFKRYVRGRKLDIINGYALSNVPSNRLTILGDSARRVHHNRNAVANDLLSSTAVQADVLAQQYSNLTGAGVTVAVIDSGISSYPLPDLKDRRVIKFVDFVAPSNGFRTDLNGHGTHVSGIIGGTGADDSRYAGIAPGTKIISLRVLDENGRGTVADIIAAMDWVWKHAAQYNIRVVNMSVGAGVYESYWTDPLTLAAKALVDQGITVVAAAGNFGKNKNGELQFGGITSPGVAPWVLTVCAFSTMGTMDRADDVMASFSSAGPTAVDFIAKPDICAPGVGIVSLAAPESRLYNLGALATPSWLLGDGTLGYSPYISLTGTSQATPFVAGTVALMLQVNPHLTPNLIKGILEYTSSFKPGVSPLRQGAGFMNTLGAVDLAKFYANPQPGQTLPVDPAWSQHFIWGNHMLDGGVLDPNANAWMPGVEWGYARTQGDDGDNIVWGTLCDDCDNIVWGTADDGDNIVWGTFDDDNIVWGTIFDGDNIVWGTADGDDNIVWGTDCGGADCDNIVWGTVDPVDNIVWGTADDGDNIVWGTADDGDNIVWGTFDDDNIVWGTIFDGDNIVWGTGATENVVWPYYRNRKGGK